MQTPYYNSVIFVILEKHMMNNYTYLDSILSRMDIKYRVLYLPYIPSNMSLTQRAKEGRYHLNTIKDYVHNKFPNGIAKALILYSSGEGFIFSNKSYWLPSIYDCKEVILQHGIMPMTNKYKAIRIMTNNILKPFLHFNILGKGFGGYKTDSIVVWGQIYKDYLVEKLGWSSGCVYVSGKMLKPNIESCKGSECNDYALLLLQNFAGCRIMSDQEQIYFFKYIVKILLKYYNKVIIRKHPKMTESIYKCFENSDNIIFSKKNLLEDIVHSCRVFSFTSSALVDAYLMGKEIVAILCPKIPKSGYTMFNRVVQYNCLDEYLKDNYSKDIMATIKKDFFYISDNVRLTICELLKNNEK